MLVSLSLSPESDPKLVYSLLCSIANSSSSSSSFPNFPNCSSPSELASIYANYSRNHFSVSQPKVFCNKARGCLSELRPATSSEKSHSSFCFPFSFIEFFAAATNLSFHCHWPNKISNSVLKHLPRFGMDFLLYIFNSFWYLHLSLAIWKTSMISIHKMETVLNSSASFWPISYLLRSKLFIGIYYKHWSVFYTLFSET